MSKTTALILLIPALFSLFLYALFVIKLWVAPEPYSFRELLIGAIHVGCIFAGVMALSIDALNKQDRR